MTTLGEALAALDAKGELSDYHKERIQILMDRGSLDINAPYALQPSPEGDALPGVGSGVVQYQPTGAELPAEPAEPLTVRQELMKEIAGEMGPLESFFTGMGSGLATLGRGTGLVDEPAAAESEAMAALKTESPYTTGAGEIAGEALPFLPLGVAAGAIESLPLRVLASGVVGGAEGGIISKGKGSDVAMGTGMGAGIAVGAEILFPVLGRLGRKLFQRVTGKVPKGAMLDAVGNPSDELKEALDAAGMSFEDLTDDAVEVITGQPPGAKPEQVIRKQFLEGQGIDPTKAQITRNAADFQAQQEAAKTSSKVRSALETQEAHLTTRFDQKVLETGGQAYSPTVGVIDEVVDKATKLDQEISDLYKVARDSAPGSEVVSLESLVKQVKRYQPSNRKTGGNISAIIGELKDKGVLDEKMKLAKNLTVEQAEEVRQYLNKLYDPKNGFGNMILRELKNNLDDDVFKSAGGDLFGQARSAKAGFEKELNRAKISKFDSRKQNLVRSILENQIDPDQFVEKVVFGKTWRPADLKQLQDYVGVGAGWNDLKADVLEKIKDRAFIGPEDAEGFRALSRHKIEGILNKIGDKKLKIIFNSAELNFLKDMLKVSKLREPVRGTALGMGPSAQAIGLLARTLKGIPLMKSLVESIERGAQGKAVLKAVPEKIKVPYIESRSMLSPATTAVAVPAAITSKEKE